MTAVAFALALCASAVPALAPVPPERAQREPVPAPRLQPHRFHVTLGQAEYELKTGSLEVALRVDPFDLEEALTAAHGSKVDLDRTPRIDEHIARYLKQRFVLRTPTGEHAPLEWVGKEDFTLEMWLYFELPVAQGRAKPADLAGYSLENRVFFELHPEQTNVLTFGRGEARRSLRFTPEAPRADLKAR